MRIAAIPYIDMDVYEGMVEILKSNPDAMVLLPITEHKEFTKTVVKAIQEVKNPYAIFVLDMTDDIKDVAANAVDVYVTDSPIHDILESITHGDILAVIDDGSEKFSETLDMIEQYGLTTVNMKDGTRIMSELDNGFDDGLAEVMDSLDVFMESLIRYVAQESLKAMRESLLESMARLNKLMEDHKENDWDDLDDDK